MHIQRYISRERVVTSKSNNKTSNIIQYTFVNLKVIMHSFHLLLTLFSGLFSISIAENLKVNVYEGPTECDDRDKVQNGNYLKMHYTGTIDESSETGEKGSKFDSSRDRGQTFDFQIGKGQVIKGCKIS